MSYDIQAACDAASQRLARTLERSIGQHKRAIRKAFAEAEKSIWLATSGPSDRRREGSGVVSDLGTTARGGGGSVGARPMVSEGTASAQRIQYGRVMYEACAASDCDPITGECLGHCMAVMA